MLRPEGGDDPRDQSPFQSLPQEEGENIGAKVGGNSDGPIWRDGAFHADAWRAAPEDGDLPNGPLVVSKKRWLADREALVGRNAPLGLRLEPSEALDELADDLRRLALIALSFPKFSDGRAFSTARLLREKHGFAGELRAVGNVLADQIPFMRRVGFDSYEVDHAPTRKALTEGRIAEVSLHYQPGERAKGLRSR
jgi:uncharacterized protein (DUF934 family)